MNKNALCFSLARSLIHILWVVLLNYCNFFCLASKASNNQRHCLTNIFVWICWPIRKSFASNALRCIAFFTHFDWTGSYTKHAHNKTYCKIIRITWHIYHVSYLFISIYLSLVIARRHQQISTSFGSTNNTFIFIRIVVCSLAHRMHLRVGGWENHHEKRAKWSINNEIFRQCQMNRLARCKLNVTFAIHETNAPKYTRQTHRSFVFLSDEANESKTDTNRFDLHHNEIRWKSPILSSQTWTSHT